MKERNPWHTPLTIIIAVVGVIAIVALVTVAVLQNKPLTPKYKYGIVLDAGSSHTAMYIYQWPAEKDNNTGRVEQTNSCKVKGPGISSYASDPKMAAQSLQVCMKEAEQYVPSERHQETPLYLGATAGMRLLNIENSAASDQVFQAVSESLQKSPFSFQGARILSGQEEGAFGWVTVNYLDDRLKQGLETTGALDLGGASTQISFISDTFDSLESPTNAVTFRLYGNDYNLYTHSFLCYGKDQVLRMSIAHQTKSGPGSISDPCFHNGYNEIKNYTVVYDSPCVSARKPTSGPATFTHSGRGNFDQCQELVKNVFDFTQCKYSQCSFNGVFQPTLQGPFVAFSAYFFVMDFLNLTDTSVPLEKVKEALAGFCATPWDTIKTRYPSVKLKYLSEYCFSGTYILTLLTEGYNFTSETFSNIKFIKKIKGSDAGWTLGYMLNLTNMIPAEAPDTPLLPHAGYVSVITFIALVLFLLFILSLRPLWPRCSQKPQIV
ncbi:ectonucleoside triphosphate diphosphohydrolase 1 isoform X2 [Boleophthalmus pectinirostris]|nr:ectonucleoside triphosphate diphosphohydrolase 1 isoform X2 [Boleophthalmus pectinirostris]XP_055006247.1 ectonucleoside triphosphate diphosphohydrolase 1 isoform X2 [Boleophthalmus pectinirostris]XP_055006248.1 ectonucleoside triphosphate diphosphohydrolase 1 isoform X2 [Boleophthalmus pectinirostris]